jgi:hypothetical protein
MLGTAVIVITRVELIAQIRQRVYQNGSQASVFAAKAESVRIARKFVTSIRAARLVRVSQFQTVQRATIVNARLLSTQENIAKLKVIIREYIGIANRHFHHLIIDILHFKTILLMLIRR